MSTITTSDLCPSLPEAACLQVAVQRVAYHTIGSHQYLSDRGVRLSIMIRVQPSLDLGPFVDTTRLNADLTLASLDVVVESQDSLQHIGNVVAQYLTRKTQLYATRFPEVESGSGSSSRPSTLREHLPPVLVPRSSLLFAVRSWPWDEGSMLLADGILVDDMMILQDWDTSFKEISKPGDLTLYCVLASVRVLMDDEGN